MEKPHDFSKISKYIDDTEAQMKKYVENFDKTVKEHVNYWDIFKLNHIRTHYISEEFKHRRISRDTFLYCCNKMYCDAGLLSYWKKDGYRKLCCLQCAIPQSDNKKVCKCRSLNSDVDEEFHCNYCGCANCSG